MPLIRFRGITLYTVRRELLLVFLMRTSQFAVLLVALFILGVMVSIPKLNATCSGNWTGAAGDGKWETAGNWNNNCVPTNDATIPDGAFVVTISTPQSLTGSIVVGVGDTLVCAFSCTLTIGGALNVVGTVTNVGTIIVIAGVLILGSVVNFGTFTIQGPPGFFTNEGSFIDKCGGTVNKAPEVNPVETVPCVVGGEVLSLDYGSLMLSVVPWILIIATLVAGAAAIIIRQKFKPF